MTGSQASVASFEIAKDKQKNILLKKAKVKRHLHSTQLLDGLEEGFRQLERGAVRSPPRPEITIPRAGFR
jgi:hypothetical protein